MVAVFLRLRLVQLANSIRRPPVQLFGLVIILGYAVVGTVYAVGALDGLRSTESSLAGSVLVIAGSIVTLGFLLVPLLFGGDDPADPRVFAVLGIPAKRVLVGLAASSLLSVPAILLIIVVAAQVPDWVRQSDAPVFALFAAILIVASSVLGARLSRTVAALWLRTKRARDVTRIIALAALLATAPSILGLATTNWHEDDSVAALAETARAFGQTPVGAAWAAPGAASAGDSGDAWLKLLIGALFVLVLWAAWQTIVGRMLVTRQRPDAATAHGGLGWFGWLPGTPVGAIAARSLSYWLRDGRYRLALLAIPIVPLLLIPPLFIAGVWWQNLALIPLPLMCLFLGWIVHNDTASDNTALWLHIASNTSGLADRLGRVVPALIVGIPLVMIGSPITAQLYGELDLLPSVIGVSSCLLLAGLGVSSYVSARHPYPTVRPGDSPFAQPQSTTSSPGQALSFFGTIVLSLPVLGLAGVGLAIGDSWNIVALVAGLAIGVGVFVLGIAAGARYFSRRAPELLAFSLRN